MNEHGNGNFTLPTQIARRRRLVGRMFLIVFCFNVVFAIVAGWALSGPAAGLTRFSLGWPLWSIILLAAVSLLAVPLLVPLTIKLLRPPPEDEKP